MDGERLHGHLPHQQGRPPLARGRGGGGQVLGRFSRRGQILRVFPEHFALHKWKAAIKLWMRCSTPFSFLLTWLFNLPGSKIEDG